jgi:hypothetical protein
MAQIPFKKQVINQAPEQNSKLEDKVPNVPPVVTRPMDSEPTVNATPNAQTSITTPDTSKLRSASLSKVDCTPAHWSSEVQANGKVIFINSVSGKTFEGTPKEFSRMLRGI